MNSYSLNNLYNFLDKSSINDTIELKELLYNISFDDFYNLIDNYKNKYHNDSGIYYRHSIYKKNNFEVVLIYWCPYSYSRIHSHPNKGCIMKVLKGYLDIDLYDDSDYSTIQHYSCKTILEDQIEYIKGKHGIHRISNDKNSDYAISFHIYMY